MIYENFSYTDPVQGRSDPPLAFDSPDPAERTLRYCGTYENGLTADGAPDPAQVTRAVAGERPRERDRSAARASRSPAPRAESVRRARAPTTPPPCDSSPGAGDGECDACPITGGESTENEMFNLFGLYYIEPSVAAEDAAAGVATAAQLGALAVDARGRSLATGPILPAGAGCALAHPGTSHAMHGVVPATDGHAGHAHSRTAPCGRRLAGRSVARAQRAVCAWCSRRRSPSASRD